MAQACLSGPVAMTTKAPTEPPTTKTPTEPPTTEPTKPPQLPKEYTTPGSPNWPDATTWQRDLGAKLSTDAKLIDAIVDDTETMYDASCPRGVGPDQREGVCMVHEACAFQFCHLNGKAVFDLPAYVVKARTTQDVQQAMLFAEKHNIPVSVKTSGHSEFFITAEERKRFPERIGSYRIAPSLSPRFPWRLHS